MDTLRVVWVGRRASGYLLTPALVLTSAHAVGREGDRCTVATLRGGRTAQCEVVWTPEGRAGSEDDRRAWDAALLRVTDADWDDRVSRLPPARWGRLVTERGDVPWETVGFPRRERLADGGPNPGHLRGVFSQVHRLADRTYALPADAGTRHGEPEAGRSPLRGLSGAALLSGDLVIGVVRGDATAAHGHLTAVKARELFTAPDFPACLATETGVTPVLEPVELQGLVEPRTPLPAPASPADLLHPRRAVVRLQGREDLLDAFTRWCLDAPAALRVLAGPGGQGKTRFAQALMARLAARGWAVAFLDHGRRAEAAVDALTAVRQPLLLVVDYADARRAHLRDVVEAVAARDQLTTPLKVLCLARSGRAVVEPLRRETSQAVRNLAAAAEVVTLPPPTLASPAGAYRAVRQDLAAQLGRLPRVPRTAAEGRPVDPPRDVTTMLDLQMRALLELLGGATPAAAAGTPLEEALLRHERAHWYGVARDHDLLPELTEDWQDRAVALATLCQPATEADRVDLLYRAPGWPGDRTLAGRAVRWLEHLLPRGAEPTADGAGWRPLEPDRLGEAHALAVCETSPYLLAHALTFEGAQDQATAVLTRVAERATGPDGAAWAARLSRVLVAALRHVEEGGDAWLRCARTVVRVVGAAGRPSTLRDPLDAVLAALPRLPLDRVDALLPDVRECGGRLHTAFAARRAALLSDAVQRAQALLEQAELLAAEPSRHDTAAEVVRQAREVLAGVVERGGDWHRAQGAARHLEARLHRAAGRTDEALASVEAAVTARTAVTQAGTARVADHAALAEAHALRAELLRTRYDAVRRKAADYPALERIAAVWEDAVRAQRRAAQADPERYEAHTATLLMSLGTALASAGEPGRAQRACEEAVVIRRRLAERFPHLYGEQLARDERRLQLLRATVLSVGLVDAGWKRLDRWLRRRFV